MAYKISLYVDFSRHVEMFCIIPRDSHNCSLVMGLVVDGTGRVNIKLSLCMLCSIKMYGAIEVYLDSFYSE